MNPENSNSASATDTTSTNGQRKPASKPSGEATEAEFLAKQAEEAKQALSAAFGAFARDLRDGVDPRGWTKEHPWATLAGAAVAGFAAAAVFVPSKEEQALRRLVAMERALMPKSKAAHDGAAPDTGDDGGARDFARGRSGFLAAIGRQVLETIKPALMSALTAGITAKAATPENQYQAPQPPPADPNARPGDPGATPTPDDPSAAI